MGKLRGLAVGGILLIVLSACSPSERQVELRPSRTPRGDSAAEMPTATSVVSDAALATFTEIETENPTTFTLAGIAYPTRIAGRGAKEGFVILYGKFANGSQERRCIFASDIRLIFGGEEYTPDRGWMSDYQGSLRTKIDYPGPLTGQCLSDDVPTDSFMVFDVPTTAIKGSDVRLRVLGDEHSLEGFWTDRRIANRPTQPSTNTPQASNTRRPALTPRQSTARPTDRPTTASTTAPTMTMRPTLVTPWWEGEMYFTVSNLNVRSCPRTTCDVVVQMNEGEVFYVNETVEGEAVNAGNNGWFRISIYGVDGYIYSALGTKEYSGNPALLGSPAFTSVPDATVPPVSQPPSLQCPANCTEARAQGWTAEQAGQCSNLDRDGDGVACYGD